MELMSVFGCRSVLMGGQFLRARSTTVIFALVLAVACDNSGPSLAPESDGTDAVPTGGGPVGGGTGNTSAPVPLPIPVEWPPAARILIVSESYPHYIAGMSYGFGVYAYDSSGKRTPSEHVSYEVSDESMASMTTDVLAGRNTPGWKDRHVGYILLRPGVVTIRASLHGATASRTVTVLGNFPPSSALTVESFFLVEYRPCATCGFVLYAPRIILREPTGSAYPKVVGIVVSAPGFNPITCRGGSQFMPGESKHLNPIHADFYNNDLLFVNLNDVRMPDGTADARIYVQDATGAIGIVTASDGAILRDRTLADLPPFTGHIVAWSGCQY